MTSVLDIKISPASEAEVRGVIRSRKGSIITLNPEFVFYLRNLGQAEADEVLSGLTQTVDGYGLQCALIASDNSKSERITGLDIIDYIAEEASDAKVLIVGNNAKGALDQSKGRLVAKGIQDIEVYDPGKLNEDSFSNLNTKVVQGKYEVVLLGFPMKWQVRGFTELDFDGLIVGVGGAFDMISGQLKRAPKFMRRLGLEWLWRFAGELFKDARHYKVEPARFKRVPRAVIVFPLAVVFDRLKHGNIFKSTYDVFRFLLRRG